MSGWRPGSQGSCFRGAGSWVDPVQNGSSVMVGGFGITGDTAIGRRGSSSSVHKHGEGVGAVQAV